MSEQSSRTASNTILVVDDEPLNLELYTRRLSNAGYVVTTANDGQEAIHLLSIERYSVLLLDLNMPVMNGYDVLEWLQRQELPGMRVIMLTAAGERDAVNTCLTLGADDYVLKSAGMVELLHRVKRACQDAGIEARLGISTIQEKWQNAQDSDICPDGASALFGDSILLYEVVSGVLLVAFFLA